MRSNIEQLFGGNREKAIQRDGEKCVKCGMTREEHRFKFGRDITVDHINGNGKWDLKSEKPNNDMSNLQTLCMPCHGKKDGLRRRTSGNAYGNGYTVLRSNGTRNCYKLAFDRGQGASQKDETFNKKLWIHTCCGSKVAWRHLAACKLLRFKEEGGTR